MTVEAPPISPVPIHGKFANAAEWLHSLGDVPLERILMDPPPGQATEAQLFWLVERKIKLVELVNQTLVEKPVGLVESLIAAHLIEIIGAFVREKNLGLLFAPDGTLRMSGGNVRLPDVTFISWSDIPGGKLSGEAAPTLPPTLAIEVLSRANTSGEMRIKISEYFASGAKLVWLIQPKNKTVEVFESASEEPIRTLGVGEFLNGAPALPGFSISVATIFDNVSAAND